MRITENTFTRNFLVNVNNARLRMSQLQQQLSTGMRVGNPSDDPEAANRILRIKNSIGRHEMYQANVADSTAIMSSTAHALDQFSNLMVEAKDILTQARNGSRSPDLNTFADQLDQIIGDLVQIGNSQFNGKYIFGGTRTTDPPYALSADRSSVTINPNGITGRIEVHVNEGITQVVNINGEEAFQGVQIFETLIRIRDEMRGGQVPSAAQVDAVNDQVAHVATQGGKAGLILKALDMDDAFLQEKANHLAALLSADQDTDFAEATMQLKKEELMLEAALSTGARLIPKTLMDFLK